MRQEWRQGTCLKNSRCYLNSRLHQLTIYNPHSSLGGESTKEELEESGGPLHRVGDLALVHQLIVDHCRMTVNHL